MPHGRQARDAHEAVKALALRLGTGEATRDDQVLEEKLRKATGVSVADGPGNVKTSLASSAFRTRNPDDISPD